MLLTPKRVYFKYFRSITIYFTLIFLTRILAQRTISSKLIYRIFPFILYLFFIQRVYSQIQITAFIKDQETQKGIPYASVSIVGTALGTLTNENGKLELKIPSVSTNDTLKISAIGYSDQYVIVKDISLNTIYLDPIVYDLTEVKVKPKKVGYKYLGTNDYSDNTCTSFMDKGDNWLGKQAAILAGNKPGTSVYIESFGFYIIKNEYTDSLTFRLMLYEIDERGYPGKTFLKKPIIFSTQVKQGEVRLDLRDQHISTSNDFFISLECLEEKMEASKFCFAGSIKTPSYFKSSPVSRWGKVKGGGGAFNIKVSYKK